MTQLYNPRPRQDGRSGPCQQFPYVVETLLNGVVIDVQRIPDPFVRQVVHVSRLDLIRALFRRGALDVDVRIGADRRVIDRVVALDRTMDDQGRDTRTATGTAAAATEARA